MRTIIYYKRDAKFEPGPASEGVGEDYYIQIPIVNNTVNVVDTLKAVGYNVSDSGEPALTGNLNTPLQNVTGISILDSYGKYIIANGENVYDLLNELAKQLPKPD